MSQLRAFGLDAGWQAAFDQYNDETGGGLTLARVIAAQGQKVRLITGSGELDAETSGSLRYFAAGPGELPVTGDWVAARVVGGGEALVQAVLPRRTVFSRRAAGRRNEEQVLAANLDAAMIVCGLDNDFNLRRLERYAALAAASRADALFVLSKRDLCPEWPARVAETACVVAGWPVLAASAQTGAGLEQFDPHLTPGRTVALLGSSGAGKSTLINALLGWQRQETRPVRDGDDRGRHTTTRRELIPLAGGAILMDTPGLRELQLWASEESVNHAFPEIEEAAGGCRFRDCRHDGEPGCAVRQAADDGHIDAARLAAWRKLRVEAEHIRVTSDLGAALAQKKRWKAIHREIKRHYKDGRWEL